MDTLLHSFIAAIEPYFAYILTAPFFIGSAFLVVAVLKPAFTVSSSEPIWKKLREIFTDAPVFCPNCSAKMSKYVMWVEAYYRCDKCGHALDLDDGA